MENGSPYGNGALEFFQEVGIECSAPSFFALNGPSFPSLPVYRENTKQGTPFATQIVTSKHACQNSSVETIRVGGHKIWKSFVVAVKRCMYRLRATENVYRAADAYFRVEGLVPPE